MVLVDGAELVAGVGAGGAEEDLAEELGVFFYGVALSLEVLELGLFVVAEELVYFLTVWVNPVLLKKRRPIVERRSFLLLTLLIIIIIRLTQFHFRNSAALARFNFRQAARTT